MCSQAASLQVCWLRARKSTAWFKVTVQFFLRGIFACLLCARASQVALVVKNPPANARDVRDAGLIPGSGRSPGGGHGNLLQYSCLKNPMDRGAWQAQSIGSHRFRHDRSDLACTHALLFRFFSYIGHYRDLNSVPCAI